MTRLLLGLTAFLILLGACADDPDSTAALLQRMRARYDANRGAIGGFVAVGGGARATYGPLPDSTGALDPPAIEPSGSTPPDQPAIQLLMQQVANVRLLADTLRTATFDGPRDLHGHRVYILTREPSAPDQPTLFVVVDAETFDIREIEQSIKPDSLQRPLVQRIVYDDFRTVGGFTAPFRIRQVTEGIDQLIPETERIVMGGQATMARGQTDMLPPGPERDARRARFDADIRLYTRGERETDLRIDSLRVLPKVPAR